MVVGAGAAGCSAAFTLRRAGHEVVLLEAAPEIGGRTRTVERDGFGIEVGAIYMLNSYDRCIAMLELAGRSGLLAGWSPTAGLWDGEALHPLRYDYIPSFFRLPLLRLRDRIRLAVKAVQAVLSPAPEPFETDSLAEFDDGEDLETWSRRELGDNLFEYFVRPLIEPSFGVDCRDLSTPYLRGVMKRAHRAKFRLPVLGMGSVCAALAEDIDVRVSTAATSIERVGAQWLVGTSSGERIACSGIVVAADASVAAGLVGPHVGTAVAEVIQRAPYASMANVSLRWESDPVPDHLVEMLLPVGVGQRAILGTIVKTSGTSGLVPKGGRLTNTYFCSEASRSMTHDELIDAAVRHLGEIYGSELPQPKAEVFVIDKALASCPPGHYQRMQAVRMAMPAGLALAGDYLAHLGVETAVVSGERAAQDLLARAG